MVKAAAVVLKVEGLAGPGGRDNGDAARVGQVGRERDGAGEPDVGEAPSLAGVRQRRRRRAVMVGPAGVAHGMSGVVDRPGGKSCVPCRLLRFAVRPSAPVLEWVEVAGRSNGQE